MKKMFVPISLAIVLFAGHSTNWLKGDQPHKPQTHVNSKDIMTSEAACVTDMSSRPTGEACFCNVTEHTHQGIRPADHRPHALDRVRDANLSEHTLWPWTVRRS